MTPYDLKLTALLLILTPLAWFLRPRRFYRIARRVDRLLTPLYRTDDADLVSRAAAVAGGRIDRRHLERVVPTLRRLSIREAMLVLSANRPWSEVPEIEIEGLENLRTASENGGVILWDAYFAQHETINAIGLSAAGYRPCYVRIETHGFSPTDFGRRILNPIHRRALERYCDYIVLDGNPAAGIRALKNALDAAKIVAMVASPSGGRGLATIPFFDGELLIVPGPAKLAATIGVPVLPVHNYLDPEWGTDHIVIGPPLTIPSDAREHPSAEGLLESFASWLESVVEEKPEQWVGWSYVARRVSNRDGSPDVGDGSA